MSFDGDGCVGRSGGALTIASLASSLAYVLLNAVFHVVPETKQSES